MKSKKEKQRLTFYQIHCDIKNKYKRDIPLIIFLSFDVLVCILFLILFTDLFIDLVIKNSNRSINSYVIGFVAAIVFGFVFFALVTAWILKNIISTVIKLYHSFKGNFYVINAELAYKTQVEKTNFFFKGVRRYCLFNFYGYGNFKMSGYTYSHSLFYSAKEGDHFYIVIFNNNKNKDPELIFAANDYEYEQN